MNNIVSNMCNVFKEMGVEQEEEFFSKATESEIKQFRELVGANVDKVVEFYKEYQPAYTPEFPCYLKLIDIESIIEENSCAEPGMHLAKFGVITFAITAGGNAVCFDVNDSKDGDPTVLIVDSGFCFYDDEINEIVVATIPDRVVEQFDLSQPNILDYKSIQLCATKINDSFLDFMKKLSESYYEDIETYLEE